MEKKWIIKIKKNLKTFFQKNTFGNFFFLKKKMKKKYYYITTNIIFLLIFNIYYTIITIIYNNKNIKGVEIVEKCGKVRRNLKKIKI